MDIKAYRKVLFPLACLFLILLSFSLDAFESNFSMATAAACFLLIVVEVLVLLFKSYTSWWHTVKWFVLALILLLTLIG
ncbi:hypothetical protein [uncultured Arcticibacterium sp.]|uniref:hypothetical protein n=1 Tax=uncultured Arcticibacterium sp. TaxID=2173042 RepID=UPI0030F65CAD